MADQNKSSKKGMNTSSVFADDIDRSPVLSELERIGAKASRKSIQRDELENRFRSEEKLLNQLLAEGEQTPQLRSSPFYQEQVESLHESISNVRGRMNRIDARRRERAETEASNYITRQFSSTAIGSQVSQLQKETTVQNRAFSMAGQSYDELARRREDVLSEIRVRERSVQGEIRGMFDKTPDTKFGEVKPSSSAAVHVAMSGTREQLRELATIQAAQVIQKSAGRDPNSSIRSLAESGAAAEKMVAAGDGPKEVMSAALALTQALKELSKSAGETDEKLAELRETANESAENFEKLKEASAGGGGRYNAASVAMGLAGGFGAIGGAAQQILVTQRMQEVANVAGFAGLANQQYDMYRKARGGDVASQLALQQFGEAEDFGTEMKHGTTISQTAYLAAGAAQAGAGGIQMAEGGVQKFNPMSYFAGTSSNNTKAVITGAQNVVQGLATSAITGSEMLRETTAQSARLAGIQAQMQARQAIMAVPAEQMQGLRNFYTDLNVSSQQMGAGAESFLQRATSMDTLQSMQESGLSPEQFAKLAQQGGAAMGTTFDQGSIFQARAMERAGFGDASTNIQRMATLAQAGGNNPQASMQGVMEAAFTKSLDSSKALSMMVENTAAMAAGTTAATMGIDTTAATATMLAAGVNEKMGNKEAAIAQAMSAAEVTQQITTNNAATFSGMLNTAAIQRATGISNIEAIAAQELTIQEYKAVQGDPQKAMELYRNKGINIKSTEQAAQFTETMLGQKQDQLSRDRGLALNVDVAAFNERLRAAGSIENVSKDDKFIASQMAIGRYAGGGDEFLRQFFGVTAANTKEGIDKATKVSGGEGGDLQQQLDNLRVSGFKQLTEAAMAAAKNIDAAFGKQGSAIKFFTQLQEKFEKGGTQTEEDFSTAGADFAKNFNASLGKFDKATDEYSRASRAMIQAAGLISNRNPVMPQAVSDALDQMKGRKQ